jgi:hypothetical protein
MSQQPPRQPPDPPEPPEPSEPPPDDKDSKALEKSDETVEALLEHVPQNLIRETLVGIIREGASPRIDPDTFKLAAQTAQQEQDNRLTFLMRKLDVEDIQNNRQHELEVEKHKLDVEQSRSVRQMCWPVLVAAIVVVLGGIAAGIYLAATGKETLGFSILSAIVTALFAYIGGLGTPRFWKE